MSRLLQFRLAPAADGDAIAGTRQAEGRGLEPIPELPPVMTATFPLGHGSVPSSTWFWPVDLAQMRAVTGWANV